MPAAAHAVLVHTHVQHRDISVRQSTKASQCNAFAHESWYKLKLWHAGLRRAGSCMRKALCGCDAHCALACCRSSVHTWGVIRHGYTSAAVSACRFEGAAHAKRYQSSSFEGAAYTSTLHQVQTDMMVEQANNSVCGQDKRCHTTIYPPQHPTTGTLYRKTLCSLNCQAASKH